MEKAYLPIFLLLLLAGCGREITCTGVCGGNPRVCEALELAGENRPQLEMVLQHYRTPSDSLKLRAAHFLIANMEGQSFYRFALLDSLDNEHQIEVLAYPDYATMVAAFDSVEALVGELHWDSCDLRPDLEFINGDYLIDNIDLAFQAWKSKPWSSELDFDDFCNNVLPYRGSSEPLESWRQYFLDKYADLPSRMTDPSDPVEAATLINQDIKTWFKFDERFYRHPTDQGLTEMLSCRMGRCEDMTNLAIYAMRANGLAVTSDYTPHWADSGNNHAWNSILISGNKVVPFMGCERDPGEYHLRSRMAKAYRKGYARNFENLIYKRDNEDEKLPGWLRGRSYQDVTPMYTPVSDVLVSLPYAPDDVQFAYLCVFNDGEWKPIHWGEIIKGRAVFTDMGTDICYLPMCFDGDKLVPVGDCLLLEKQGPNRVLVSRSTDLDNLDLVSTTQRSAGVATDSIEEAAFAIGTTYELFHWDRQWQSLGKQTADGGKLHYAGVPRGGLFWLVADGSRKDERIFIWNGSRQVWY